MAKESKELNVKLRPLDDRIVVEPLEAEEKTAPGSVHAAAPAAKEVAFKDKDKNKDQKQDVQGVFVIRNRKAEFVPVTTGVAGTTDIEVVDGLREGDEVITGSYKILRTLRSGSGVKIDNSVPKKEDESS